MLVQVFKNTFGSETKTSIVSNEEMENIIKVIKSLKISGLLIKVVTQTIENETNKQRGGFFAVLLGIFSSRKWWNMSADKETIAINQGRGVICAEEERIRAEQDS